MLEGAYTTSTRTGTRGRGRVSIIHEEEAEMLHVQVHMQLCPDGISTSSQREIYIKKLVLCLFFNFADVLYINDII